MALLANSLIHVFIARQPGRLSIAANAEPRGSSRCQGGSSRRGPSRTGNGHRLQETSSPRASPAKEDGVYLPDISAVGGWRRDGSNDTGAVSRPLSSVGTVHHDSICSRFGCSSADGSLAIFHRPSGRVFGGTAGARATAGPARHTSGQLPGGIRAVAEPVREPGRHPRTGAYVNASS